jgi:thioredoxin 1
MMGRSDVRKHNVSPLILVLGALALAAVVVLSGCTRSSGIVDTSVAIDTSSEPSQDTTHTVSVQVASVDAEATNDQAESERASAGDQDEHQPLPRLIDLGATKCIPCKEMAPILEELAETKKDYFEVLFFDVWENPDKGYEYGVRLIPTQIFFAANGEELYRHIGFYSRDQILDKWGEFGIDVGE